MSNIIQIKHGESKPTTDKLAQYEFGYCTGDGKLYFNANETIKSFLPNIESGFTLNNNSYIYSFLKDGTTKVGLIGRTNLNDVWIGNTSDDSQGNTYICVGVGAEGDGRGNLYVVRSHLTLKDSQDKDNRYIVYDNYSIRSGFTLNNNTSINSKLADNSDYSLIFRSSTNNTWVGGKVDNKPAIGNLYLAVGKGTGGNGEENAYVFRMSKNAQSAENGSSLIYDETSIKNGFRINNGSEITTLLSDGATIVNLIKRSNDNIWIGQRAVASQGSVYLGVGTGVDSTGYVYVARGQNYISSTDYSDLSKVYDELSIGDGFTIKNNIAIKTKLVD